SALTARALKSPPPCSVWPERLPSATSLDRSTRSISGDTATSCSATLCTSVRRPAVHMWANLSRKSCPWAAVYYEQLRTRGKSHACALRCLGQRWLKILWKMWQTGTRYEAELHARNQLKPAPGS